MAIYSLGLPTTSNTNAAAAWDMKASSANAPKIVQLDLCSGQAVAATYGVGRPANDGSVQQTGATLVQKEGAADLNGNTACAIQWSIAPTLPLAFNRRAYLPAQIEATVIWSFPRGFTIAASHGLVLWNLVASNPTPMNVGIIMDE